MGEIGNVIIHSSEDEDGPYFTFINKEDTWRLGIHLGEDPSWYYVSDNGENDYGYLPEKFMKMIKEYMKRRLNN